MSGYSSGASGWGQGMNLNPQVFGQGGAGSMNMMGMVNTGMMPGAGAAGMGATGMVGLNQAAFNQQPPMAGGGFRGAATASPAANQKARALIGVVTKIQDNYGFVDDDVFFQMTVVKGPVPRVGDRVMVEATYNQNMPFKWNASRITLATGGGGGAAVQERAAGGPGGDYDYGRNRNGPASGGDFNRGGRGGGGGARGRRSPPRRRSPPPKRSSPPRRPSSRERGSRKRDRSPSDRGASKGSPPVRQRRINTPRYLVYTPKTTFDVNEVQSAVLHRRFPRMYIPSDFICADASWNQTFPLHRPFVLSQSSSYHIMHKDVDYFGPPLPVDHPTDANYSWSAKVMLLASQPMEYIYEKLFNMKDGFVNIEESFEPSQISKMLSFLCGMKGKSEVMAIGGPWSPSLDGADPENDPRVLIKTAIRTTQAMVGIDLSKCTRWCKVLEVRYRRVDREASKEDSAAATADGGTAPTTTTTEATTTEQPPRLERVVLFLPDIWSCAPTQTEFDTQIATLNSQRDEKLAALDPPPSPAEADTAAPTTEDAAPTADEAKADESMDTSASQEPGTEDEANESTASATAAGGEDPDEKAATHWSKLDVKNLKVAELRSELEARGMDSKGIKSQLVSRLQKQLKSEEDDEKAEATANAAAKEMDNVESAADGKTAEEKKAAAEEERKKRDEEREKQRKKDREERDRKEKKAAIERHFKLGSTTPGFLVFPSKTAKGGKFDCRVMSLQALTNYRQEDNKEHSFEVAMFAEAFTDMMTRDAAFQVYKGLLQMPDAETLKAHQAEKDAVKEAARAEAEKKAAEEAKTEAAAAGDELQLDSDLQVKDEIKEETEADQAVKEEKKREDRKKAEKPPTVFRVTRPDVLMAFVHFDQNVSGYLLDKDAEEIVASLGLGLSRAQMHKLLKKASHEDKNKFKYRYLVEVPKPTEVGAAIDENILLADIPADTELSKGIFSDLRGPPAAAATPKTRGKGGPANVTDNPTVIFDGRTVDISQVLAQLERLEKSRLDSSIKIASLDKNLATTQEEAEKIERKRKNLEEESRDYRKRLHESEKTERKALDEAKELKNALRSSRDYARYIERLVDRAIPPPPAPVAPKKEEGDAANGEDAKKDAAATPAKENNGLDKEDENEEEELAVRDEIVENEKPEADMETS